MDLSKNEKLIYYLVEKLSGVLTRTKLVKLLYLIDLESYKKRERKISEFEWFFHNHGPYPTTDFQKNIDSLVEKGLIKENKQKLSGKDGHYYLYEILKSEEIDPFEDDDEKLIANQILVDYGSYSLDRLLDYVYHSSPFEGTNKGDKIDFERIGLDINPQKSNTELD